MGSMSAALAKGERKHELAFSSFNNQGVETKAGTKLESDIRIGRSYVWDSRAMVKWKLDDSGTAADPLQSSPNPLPSCGLAVVTAMSFRNLRQAPSAGFSLHAQGHNWV